MPCDGAVGIMSGAAKLCRHLQSDLDGEGAFWLAEAEETGLMMHEDIGEVSPGLHGLLEMSVGLHAVEEMSLDAHTSVEEGNVVVEGDAYAWDRACVDAERLAACGECLRLEGQRFLSLSDGEGCFPVTHLEVELLEEHVAGEMGGGGEVGGVAYGPESGRVALQRSLSLDSEETVAGA